MKLVQQIALCLLLVSPVASYSLSSPTGPGVASKFTVDEHTQVPGSVLPKGEYTIRSVDHLSDRMIVRVDRNGKWRRHICTPG